MNQRRWEAKECVSVIYLLFYEFIGFCKSWNVNIKQYTKYDEALFDM